MSRIRLSPSLRDVACAAGDTVLGALEKAGYALPNNCRAGACGECKVKVVSGQFDQGMVLDMALTQDERKQGYGLMCMAKPISEELVIEWGTEDAKPKLFPPREHQRYVVVDRLQRTPRIIELHLRPVAAPMRYWPGQYITLGDERAGAPPRCYSVANAPRPDGTIVLQITRVDDGQTSRWIHEQVQVGSVIKVNGPYGTFIGDPAVESPVLCLAAGSGLAPILALAEAALRRGYRKPVTLMFSARTPADLYADGLLAYWQTKHRNFTYMPCLTRLEAGQPLPAGAQAGRIPEVLRKRFPDLSAYSVFIAGSPAFVADCSAAVKALGAQPELLHTEGYFGQAQPEVVAASRMTGS